MQVLIKSQLQFRSEKLWVVVNWNTEVHKKHKQMVSAHTEESSLSFSLRFLRMHKDESPPTKCSLMLFFFLLLLLSSQEYALCLWWSCSVMFLEIVNWLPSWQQQDVLCKPTLQELHVETENREHWISKHPPTPYISPFQSFINGTKQAGALLFSLHHAIPPARIHPLSSH